MSAKATVELLLGILRVAEGILPGSVMSLCDVVTSSLLQALLLADSAWEEERADTFTAGERLLQAQVGDSIDRWVARIAASNSARRRDGDAEMQVTLSEPSPAIETGTAAIFGDAEVSPVAGAGHAGLAEVPEVVAGPLEETAGGCEVKEEEKPVLSEVLAKLVPFPRFREKVEGCWQCGSLRHVTERCPKPKSYDFCFHCGMKGFRTSTFPNPVCVKWCQDPAMKCERDSRLLWD